MTFQTIQFGECPFLFQHDNAPVLGFPAKACHINNVPCCSEYFEKSYVSMPRTVDVFKASYSMWFFFLFTHFTVLCGDWFYVICQIEMGEYIFKFWLNFWMNEFIIWIMYWCHTWLVLSHRNTEESWGFSQRPRRSSSTSNPSSTACSSSGRTGGTPMRCSRHTTPGRVIS